MGFPPLPFRLDSPQVVNPKAAFWETLMRTGIDPLLARAQRSHAEEVANAREVAGQLMHGYTSTGNPAFFEHAMQVMEGIGKSKPKLLGKDKNLQSMIQGISPLLRGDGTEQPSMPVENPGQMYGTPPMPQGTDAGPGIKGVDYSAAPPQPGQMAQPSTSPTQGGDINPTPGVPAAGGPPSPPPMAQGQAPQPQPPTSGQGGAPQPQAMGGAQPPPPNPQVFSSYDVLGSSYANIAQQRMQNVDDWCNKSLQWSQRNPARSNYNDIQKRCNTYKQGIMEDNQKATDMLMSFQQSGASPQEAAKYVGAAMSKDSFLATRLMQEHQEKEAGRQERLTKAHEALQFARDKMERNLSLEGEKLGLRRDQLNALTKARKDKNEIEYTEILRKAYDSAQNREQKAALTQYIEDSKTLRQGEAARDVLMRMQVNPNMAADPQTIAQAEAALASSVAQLRGQQNDSFSQVPKGGQFQPPTININMPGQGQQPGFTPAATPPAPPKASAKPGYIPMKKPDGTLVQVRESDIETAKKRGLVLATDPQAMGMIGSLYK